MAEAKWHNISMFKRIAVSHLRRRISKEDWNLYYEAKETKPQNEFSAIEIDLMVKYNICSKAEAEEIRKILHLVEQ